MTRHARMMVLFVCIAAIGTPAFADQHVHGAECQRMP